MQTDTTTSLGSAGSGDEMLTHTGFLGTSINAMTLNLWERKYELDSLVSVMRLSWGYFEVRALG